MRKHLDLLLVPIVALSTYQLYYVWLAWKGFSYLEAVAYSREERPFVYRVMIPFLARLLERLTGIQAVYCMIFLVVLSSIGLFYSLNYFYTALEAKQEYAGLFSFAGCMLTLLLILLGAKVYDIPTVMFFALSLGLLMRGKLNLYYLVFAIASINRETTFLLTLFFMVYFYNRLPRLQYLLGLFYQGAAYMVVKLVIMAAYAGARGSPMQWRPVEVLKGYVDQPVWFAVAFFLFFLILLGLALWRWNEKPLFLRVAFGTMFPVQLLLHIFLGYSYEIRVFAELFPVLFLLSAWPILETKNQPALSQTGLIGSRHN